MMQLANSKQPKLPERYIVDELIACSDRSSVYAAQDSYSNEKVAIKIFDRSAASVYMQEAAICLELDHPGFVTCRDSFYTTEGIGVIVYDFMSSGTLSELLQSRNGNLALSECRDCLNQMLVALSYLHRLGWIHSDIKPENVFIQISDDGAFNYIIGDVGGCCRAAAAMDGDIGHGTPAYSAPEVLLREQSATSDLYSLGILGYHISVGSLPFIGSINEIQKQHLAGRIRLADIQDGGYREILLSLLHRDPKSRLSCAEDVQYLIDGVYRRENNTTLSHTQIATNKTSESYGIKCHKKPTKISHQKGFGGRSLLIEYHNISDVISPDWRRTTVYSPLGAQWDKEYGLISLGPNGVRSCNPEFQIYQETLSFGDTHAKLVAAKANQVFWANDYQYNFTDLNENSATKSKAHVNEGLIFKRYACIVDKGIAVTEGALNQFMCLYSNNLAQLASFEFPGTIINISDSAEELFIITLDSSNAYLYGVWSINLRDNVVREIKLTTQIRSWHSNAQGLFVLMKAGAIVKVSAKGNRTLGTTTHQDIAAFSVSEIDEDYALIVELRADNYLLEYHTFQKVMEN